MINWLIRLSQYQEVFIDENGFPYGADGDVGPDDHELVALRHALESSLDEREIDDLEMWEVESLTPEQQQRVNANFPGFVEHILSGGAAKDFAVDNWGWIRVNGSSFEVNRVDDDALDRMADYALEYGGFTQDSTIYITEQSTRAYVAMKISDILESVQMGQGALKYRILARRPSGLY